jgi:hypothetical protein
MTVRLLVISAFGRFRKNLAFIRVQEYLFRRRKVLKERLKLLLKEFLKAFVRPENRKLYQFGPFQLDARKRRLLLAGEIVSLTPKAIETLLLLIGRQGKLVEREELMNTGCGFVAAINILLRRSLRFFIGAISSTYCHGPNLPRYSFE